VHCCSLRITYSNLRDGHARRRDLRATLSAGGAKGSLTEIQLHDVRALIRVPPGSVAGSAVQGRWLVPRRIPACGAACACTAFSAWSLSCRRDSTKDRNRRWGIFFVAENSCAPAGEEMFRIPCSACRFPWQLPPLDWRMPNPFFPGLI